MSNFCIAFLILIYADLKSKNICELYCIALRNFIIEKNGN